MLHLNSYFLNILRAPYFPRAYASGLWLNVGTLFFISVEAPPPPTHPCFPSHHLPRKKGHMRIYPPSAPDLQTPDAEERRCRVVARQSNTQHPRVVLNKSSAPVTFAPLPPPPPPSHLHPGRLQAAELLTWLRRILCVATERPGRFPLFVPNVWSHLSVKQEGLGSPSPLGSFRYFRELHFSLSGCLDWAAGPTKGFLKWRSWGWGCRAHLLQAWGPSIINGATSTGDSSDIQPWPEDRF